jgi:hypothetical protein
VTGKALLKLARQAVDEGKVAEFLDALDRRARPGPDWGPLFRTFVQEWVETCVKKSGLRESRIESDVGIVAKHLLRPEEVQRVWVALAEMKTEDPRMYFVIGTQLTQT